MDQKIAKKLEQETPKQLTRRIVFLTLALKNLYNHEALEMYRHNADLDRRMIVAKRLIIKNGYNV